jgi:hypothetical protein
MTSVGAWAGEPLGPLLSQHVPARRGPCALRAEGGQPGVPGQFPASLGGSLPLSTRRDSPFGASDDRLQGCRGVGVDGVNGEREVAHEATFELADAGQLSRPVAGGHHQGSSLELRNIRPGLLLGEWLPPRRVPRTQLSAKIVCVPLRDPAWARWLLDRILCVWTLVWTMWARWLRSRCWGLLDRILCVWTLVWTLWARWLRSRC